MQPLAAEIHRDTVRLDGPGAPARPLARLDDEHRHPAVLDEASRGGNPGRAGADQRDIDIGGKVRHWLQE